LLGGCSRLFQVHETFYAPARLEEGNLLRS
jgi:hypothetical protein